MPLGKRQLLKYSENDMELAIQEVEHGMPYATAAKKYKVPKITLMYKVKKKTPRHRQMGRDSYLTLEEEKVLVSWISNVAKAGFLIGKNQLFDSVKHLMLELKRPTIDQEKVGITVF